MAKRKNEKENRLLQRSLAPYGKYLQEAVPSKEVCDYLMEGYPSVSDIVDVIYYSPVMNLKAKRKAIAGVMEDIRFAQNAGQRQDGNRPETMQQLLALQGEVALKCRKYLIFLDAAMDLLQKPGIFTLEFVSFNEKTEQQESSLQGVFSGFTDALEEIELWAGEETGGWSELRIWDKDGKGKMQEMATYILVAQNPVYCYLEDTALQQVDGLAEEDFYEFDMLSMTDLNLPVPFKAGDIVEVGSMPFVLRQRILITDVGDNRDCCCLQGFGKLSNGEYAVGAVKHGHVGYARSDCYIMPSLLYEMTKYDGPLNADEQILNEVAWIVKAKNCNP